MNETTLFSETVACDNCGRLGAYAFDGEHLCLDCYEARGSCCLEFGAEDLWELPDDTEPREGAKRGT